MADTERKLSAILAADAAGYIRLMRLDQAGTHAKLADHRDAVVKPCVAAHGGRIFKATVDGFLCEFTTVEDALRCAVAWQHEMAARNAGEDADRRLDFRIGVNMGDVIVEEGDIYGDGVNVAARLEGLAAPGGICISEAVQQSVKTLRDLVFEDLGPQAIKNIAEPVRAYRVLTGGEVAAPRRAPAQSWRWAAAAALVLLFAGGGFWAWDASQTEPIEPLDPANLAYPLPEKPSIAVLPFANLTGDDAQEYLADGLSEHLIASLSKLPDLLVIARNSSFTYKDKAVKVGQVAEELGVRYVLEGSVQRSGEKVRVTAQLIDAVDGYHEWAETYDREFDDIFSLQDEIGSKIVTALNVSLIEGEQARIWRATTSNTEAYELLLSGRKDREKGARGIPRAQQLFEQALQLDPEFVAAWVELANIHYYYGRSRTSESPTRSFEEAERLLQKAIALDESYPLAYTKLASVQRAWKHDIENAIELNQSAVSIAPS